MFYWINIKGGADQSIRLIPFALIVLIDNSSPVWTGVFGHKHKVMAHSTSIRVNKCRKELISIVNAGQITV